MEIKLNRHDRAFFCSITHQHFLMIRGVAVAVEFMGLYYLTNLSIWWDNHVATPLINWGKETMKVIVFFFCGLEIVQLMLCGKRLARVKTKGFLIISFATALLFYAIFSIDNPSLQYWGQVLMIDLAIMFVGFSMPKNRASISLDILITSWVTIVEIKQEIFPPLTPGKT